MKYFPYLFRHVVTRIMMAAMDPKPKTLQENLNLEVQEPEGNNESKMKFIRFSLEQFQFE